MDQPIQLLVKDSQRFYDTYLNTGINTPIKLALDAKKSITDNLKLLSVAALHPKNTFGALYAYEPVFLDIISRWICDLLIENEYCKQSGESQPLIEGSIIVNALSRLVGIHHESINLIEFYISRMKFFEKVNEISLQFNISELEYILIAFYRFINHDSPRFKRYVDPETLHRLTRIDGTGTQVVKYLATMVLCRYINASEHSEQSLLVNITSPVGEYEGDKDINFEHFSFLEAKRLSSYKNLPERIHTSTSCIEIPESDVSSLVHIVCGKLVPKHNITLQLLLNDESFVSTQASLRVISEVTDKILMNKPVILYGAAGSGKTYLINQLAKRMGYHQSIVKVHLGDQTDAKILLGTYTSGPKPGSFEWREGVLTTAVREGKWLLIEDIDRAPTEVLSVLLPLLENRKLSIPSRGEVIRAANGFQIIATIRVNSSHDVQIPDIIGIRNWSLILVTTPSDLDLRAIIQSKYPLLANLIPYFLRSFNEVVRLYSSNAFVSLNKGSHPRIVSIRDLMKLCARCNKLLQNGNLTLNLALEDSTYDDIFAEIVDCFASALPEHRALEQVVNRIGEVFEIPVSRVNLYLSKHVPSYNNDDDRLAIGRVLLKKDSNCKTVKSANATSFARTNHSLKLMEQIGAALQMTEPILLVGETGTGKTTVVQQMAKLMNKKITIINVSQQTESSDLLGGYKPVTSKVMALPIQEMFEDLFSSTFSKKKNERFTSVLNKCFSKSQWKNVVKLWLESVKMARGVLSKEETEKSKDNEAPKKKRKLDLRAKDLLLQQWYEFEQRAKSFQTHSSALEDAFVFDFIEGSLVKAVRNGEWLLLDEINLASPDTLESIADLITDNLDERSLLLTEKGDINSVNAHNEFRIFACMNPSTDIGKRDLPLSIRSRFSEIYVHSPDRDIQDLLAIIDNYVNRYAVIDEWLGNDIAELYMSAKKLAETNQIVDGANQRPHFSIRTLTRTLLYVTDIVNIYGIRRSLYEGFCMSFLTLLDLKSESILHPIIKQFTIDKLKNSNSVMRQIPPDPSNGNEKYVQFKHYWLSQGSFDITPQPHYIITPFVEKNILNLVRATSGKRFPVLIQGPTSAGKTSMIQYLANISGHKFVRINNHEHTDLQEYLGTYVAVNGKLEFKEGILVEALKHGHWIVLDELNLAPTDVLEALNRLLDDNRELFIPETQEVVHPHPDFMLFATQNPPGMYGGRKVLSRAFKNRFLELHFDDIPQDELETILNQRCQIAPSYSKKIVEVYRQLSVQRQSTRLFEQKNSFATLRDLFRWALRGAVGYEELAAHGYMILAERVRVPEEREIVLKIIEKVMRVKLDMDAYYENLENKVLIDSESSLVWTKGMRRLAVLVATSMKYKEPLLLVGETGCGKTTVCQILAHFENKKLVTVNAHQNTETSDLLGAQRPVRNRNGTVAQLTSILQNVLQQNGIEVTGDLVKDLLLKFDSMNKGTINQESLDNVESLRHELTNLFEWSDGPLVQAMKDGDFFLLDEISLADDSVLERLNSVLEPERSLLLAEKGTEADPLYASDEFQFLATMNPGGDYGKKELSPALRNRFTEIWVPSMEDMNDTFEIVQARLQNEYKTLSTPIIEFSKWYAATFGGGRISSGVISLRDILAWVEFINYSGMEPSNALFHGALLVFVDSLGTNNTSHLATDEQTLNVHKENCLIKLSEISGSTVVEENEHPLEVTETYVKVGKFSIPRNCQTSVSEPFALHAPTTALNAMRVLRGMQVKKPLLLEGSPGVGKTSLVSALAAASGNPLVRINLSEQTDLVDLFGSDVPTEGGRAGEFVWRDAPFLRAMKHGEWVLLDEMNLASQSVLEGLNACLDHRGTAYIPELGRSFPRHENFTVFAAQNPQAQGGGRKGLPKSFVNRFTVVYMDTLNATDLSLIAKHLYPTIDLTVCEGIISVISRIEKEVVIDKKWGHSGGPWEFNLRDTLRWLDMYSSKHISEGISPSEFLDMILCQRFRTPKDVQMAQACYESVFGPKQRRDKYYKLTETYLQVGGCVLPRCEPLQYLSDEHLLSLQCNFDILESALRSVVHNLPLILTGPSDSGKTSIVKLLGTVLGKKVDVFAMNSDVDSTDILGGFEQVDLTKAVNTFIDGVIPVLNTAVVNEGLADANKSQITGILRDVESHVYHTSNLSDLIERLQSLEIDIDIDILVQKGRETVNKISLSKGIRFEWFDGLLVKAVQNGNWLILDNANLCSPSVLDRLNSLLERNGRLIVNECSNEFGEPRVISPHPDFRLFLTADPKYGELSRAMRNRGVEVYLDSLQSRLTEHDSASLGLVAEHKGQVKPEDKIDLIQNILNLDLEKKLSNPVLAQIRPDQSNVRALAALHDLLDSNTITSVATGTLTPQDIAGLAKVHTTVQVSSFFDAEFDRSISAMLEEVKILQDLSIFSTIERFIVETAELLTAKGMKIPRFEKYQALNPLLNTFVDIAFDRKSLLSLGTESNFLFHAVYLLFNAKALLENVLKRALQKNAKELNYLERSAAFELGRQLKRFPKLHIFKILGSLLSFIFESFADEAASLFQHHHAFEEICNFLILWFSLAESSSGQHTSRIPIYNELIGEWYASVLQGQWQPANLESLSVILNAFAQNINMTTGLSMEIIWRESRAIYPVSAAAWDKSMQIVNLANEFDEITKKLPYSNQAQDLTLLLQEVFHDVAVKDVPGSEFNDLCSLLMDGIQKIKLMNEGSIKSNEFETEFRMLHNFLSARSFFEERVSDKISTKAGLATISTLATIRDKKLPYPAIFNSLWDMNSSKSYIDGLFTEVYVNKLFSKTAALKTCSGERLDESLSEMIDLRALTIDSSSEILSNKIYVFRSLLQAWYAHILLLHEAVLSPNVRAVFTEITNNDARGINYNEFDFSTKEKFIFTIFMEYFGPAVRQANQATTLSALGKAWVLFSCGCIQLYVPSTPYDPAQKEHIAYDYLRRQQTTAEDLHTLWKNVRLQQYGDEPIIAEDLIPAATSDIQKPEVFRFDSSSEQLFEEWDAFMKSNISASSIKALVEAAEEASKTFLDQAQLFQNNSSRLLVRLRESFTVFADMNDLLHGYVCGLKLGFGLLQIESANEVAPVPSLSWATDVNDLLSADKISHSFESLEPFLRSQEPDSVIPETAMKFFIKLCYTQKGSEVAEALEGVLLRAFQSLYYRWTLRRIKIEEEDVKKSSLFKYADSSTEIDDDFKALFPDHEEVLDSSLDVKKLNDSFDEIYYQISKDYIENFSGQKVFRLDEIVEEGSALRSAISEKENIESGYISAGSFSSLILQLSLTLGSFQKPDENINFYHGSSTYEFKNALLIVNSTFKDASKLLAEWPEHLTLQCIARCCTEFANFPISSSVSKLLQKVEQIYIYLIEWEKYAHSGVSLSSSVHLIVNLIISWRKLELKAWKSLFEHETQSLEKSVGRWWFYLFEVLLLPVFGDEKITNDTCVKITSALNTFLGQTSYGEFTIRLNLLKSFKNHIMTINRLSPLAGLLANVLSYYSQFEPVVADAIKEKKKSLEKDINEVILLARWKDVNPDALKQSARKSHNSLYKIVRKYRAVLATQVSRLIEQGLPFTQDLVNGAAARYFRTFDIPSPFYDSILTKIITWSDRPTRFRKLDRVLDNMAKYVMSLKEQKYPNLLEYTTQLMEEMELLRNQTPKKLTKENKKTIAALKSQKIKLMSDTVKEVKIMGIRTTMNSKIVSAQSTSSLVLACSESLTGTPLEGCDTYFYRMLDLLPRLRAAVAQCNEEVPAPIIEKCMAGLENLIFSNTSTRNPLKKISVAFESLLKSISVLENVLQSTKDLVKTTCSRSLKDNIERAENKLFWIDRLVSFMSSLPLGESSDINLLLEKLSAFQAAARELFTTLSPEDKVYTDRSLQWFEKYILFQTDFSEQLVSLQTKFPTLSFVTATFETLLNDSSFDLILSSTSLTQIRSVEEIEKAFRSLSNAILIAVQKVKESNDAYDSTKDEWFQESQSKLFESIKKLNATLVSGYTDRCLDTLSKHEFNSETSHIVRALVRFTMPLIMQYGELVQSLLSKSKDNYFENSKSTYLLATCVYNVATNGFCSPQEEQQDKLNDNLEDGTGLGDGSGAADSTKDIDEEDLAEAAQEENKEKNDNDDDAEDEEKDAHDIEGDMAGDLEEADGENDEENDEEEQEDLDEEMDDLEDSDPNAVDEKMWDEKVEDDKMNEKESNDVPENQDDNLEANDDNSEDKNDKTKEETNPEGDEENAEENDKGDEEADEVVDDEEQLGEQEDEVKNDDDAEALDEHVPESEVLDIPEEMNLDSDGEEEEEGQNEEIFDLKDEDIEEEKMNSDDENDSKEAEEDNQEESHDALDADEPAEKDQDADKEEKDENLEKEEENMDTEMEELKDEKMDEDSHADEASKLEAEGNDGADQNDDMTEEMNSDVKQESGKRGQGDENKDDEENEDVGASGSASLQQDQEDTNANEDQNDKVTESLKQLGDSLKEFHRRRQEIREASEKDTEQDEGVNENPEEFEHVDGANADTDTQAMGAADEDNLQRTDEEMAIDQEDEEEKAQQQPTEEVEEKDTKEETSSDNDDNIHMAEDDSKNEDSMETRVHLKFANDNSTNTEQDSIKVEEIEDTLDIPDNVVTNDRTMDEASEVPAINLSEAQELWSASEQATQELASGLCEQLRLILEPTLSTKLKGDYKTGKRLNMKRIIPYIASDFRKDKIWLRRTKPSKRQYQIMIAVDDSKSMSESKSHDLAFQSIALVSKALTQLESGELSIVRFGEDVKVVHPFDKPFNFRTSGPQVFQWFDFQQTRTDVKKLCLASLDLFERARAFTSTDIWQLQIIISDGVCEDHETLVRLVREARDKKVMLVFVILDGINQKESILDMSQVNYVLDSNGGSSLKVTKYLDSFPFEFYVVVKNINELPQMLSLILRQYFSEITSI